MEDIQWVKNLSTFNMVCTLTYIFNDILYRIILKR